MESWQNLTDIIGDYQINQEMKKKYQNTILGIFDPLGESRNVTYGWYVDCATEENPYHTMQTKLGHSFKLAQETNYEIFIPNPTRGMYNTEMGVVLFYRLPFRQYKKGLSDNSCMVELLEDKILKINPRNHFNKTIFDILNECEEGRSYSLNEETWKLIEEKGALALNKSFSITLHKIQSTGFQLYYENFLIGEITKEKILLKNPIFLQEILDTKYIWCPNHSIE